MAAASAPPPVFPPPQAEVPKADASPILTGVAHGAGRAEAPPHVASRDRPDGPAASAPRPAVEQLAPVFVALAPAVQPGAPQRLTIRLDPQELGRVQVRIERTGDGPARVELVVERADTLMLLQRDQPQLQQALDAAGVPADGRTVQLSLAPPAPEGADPAPGSGMAGSGAGGDGQQGGYRQGRSRDPGSGAEEAAPWAGRVAWRRAGVDITA